MTETGRPTKDETEAKETFTWYCLVEGIVLGPFSVAQLKQRMELGMIDGMTYCWEEGMPQWLLISDVDALKRSLLIQEEERENDMKETLLSTQTTEEPTPERKRLSLEDVPMELKFISPQGVGKIFDLKSRSWIDFLTYKKLCKDEHISTDYINLPNEMKPCSIKVQESDITKKKRNSENRQKYRERLRKRQEAGHWIKAKSNPNIYVQGLPPDITETQLNDVFKRAGVIKIDPNTCRPKIKLYRNENGLTTGDALVSFVHQDSVTIAIKYLNGLEIKPGYLISIEQAQFHIEDKTHSHTQTLTKRQHQRKKYLAAKLEQQRLLAWDDSTLDGRMKIMILRPLWSFNEAQRYPYGDPFYKNVATRLKEALSEWIYIVSVTPIERHPNGVVCVKFRIVEDCEAAIARLNQRPYFLLGLPDREVELCQQFFTEREQFWSLKEANISKNIFETLNEQNSSLLKRVDIFLEALKLLKSLKKRDSAKETDEERTVNSCLSLSDVNAAEPSLLLQLNHQEFNWSMFDPNSLDASPHLVERFNLCQRLAYFLQEYPLLIAAYIYDGKTDLKGQSLPMATQQNENIENKQQEHVTERTIQEMRPSKEIESHHEKSWLNWLVGDSDDSDSSEFMIHTEK